MAPHSEPKHFFELLAAFLARYGIFLSFWLLAVVLQIRRYRQWRTRTREIFDPALTPDWTDRRSSFGGGARGLWQGRIVTLGRAASSDRSTDAIEATMATPTPGRFLLERADAGILTRQLRIGEPPRVTPMSPDDQRLFRIRSTDRSLTDRLLSDTNARAALAAALPGPSDAVALRKGRFIVRRRFARADSPHPAIVQSLAALREMARVLG